MRSRAVWLLVVAGVLLWLVAVLPAYYVVHKPLAAHSAPPATISDTSFAAIARATGSRVADLLLLGATLVVAAAWGCRIAAWLGVRYESDLEQWGLGAILGLGLLGSLVVGLAAVGGLYRAVGYVLLALLVLLSWRETRALLQGLASWMRRLHLSGVPWLWLYTCAIGLVSLAPALLPPTGWDALVYHLLGSRLYLESHRLMAVPEVFYLNYPGQAEMLFVWGMLLKGDILAKLLHWVFWPLTAILIYRLGCRAVDQRGGRWAVALWASVPLAVYLAGRAYIDLTLTAFVLGSVFALFRWSENRSSRWLLLSAMFAGLAMATKYTAVTWLVALTLLVAYHARAHQAVGLRGLLTRVVGYVAVGGLFVAPWLLKNWWATGNPIYPFLFGGAHWTPIRESWLTLGGVGYSRNPLDYLALPWLLTVFGVGGTPGFDATIGPLLLCLAPLDLLVPRRSRLVNYGLVLVGAQLIVFCASISKYLFLAQTRLLLPAFPFLCVAAASALQRLSHWDRKSFRLAYVVLATASLVLAANLLTEVLALATTHPLAPLLGLESREDYLLRRLGAHYLTLADLDERLPEDARILFLWEPRSYYSPRPSQPDATLDTLAQLQTDQGDAETALATLRGKGFTHLVLYRAGYDYVSSPVERSPTLSGLLGDSSPEEAQYPLTEGYMRFQEDLLGHCRRIGEVASAYEIYELP